MGTPVLRYGSRSLLAFGGLVLALCVLVTASGEGLTWVSPERAPAGSDQQEDRDTDDTSSTADEVVDEEQSEDDPRPAAAPWLPTGRFFALVLLGALVAVLVGLVARLRVSLRRRRLAGDQLRATLGMPAPPEGEDDVEEPLADVLDAALGDLAHGSPRNSIVAAWLRLEEAAESDWFARNPADTPSEFVERVLSSYALDEGAIGRLAGLYREARFSAHPITDRQRDEAGACLVTLLDGLGARSRGGRR